MKLPPTVPPPSETPRLISRSKSDLADSLRRLSVLYRVFDKDSPTSLTEAGFVANAFLSCSANLSGILEKHPTVDHFEEIRAHVRNWTHGVGSPWISVTPLWLWAIVECVRRFKAGKEEVGLALIDPAQLSISGDARKVFYAMERDEIRDNLTARQWSNDPQEILVFGAIPRKAIISQVLFADIIPDLPPFFFKSSSDGCVIQNIVWRHDQKWDRFSHAHQKLLSSLHKRSNTLSPESHGKAAYDLACSLMEPKWKEVTDAILEEGQEAREEIVWNRELEALSHKVFAMGFDTTSSDDFDMEDRASMKLSELSAMIKTLAGKIASWGIDWSKDVDDIAWKAIQREILWCTKDRQSKAIDDLRNILGSDDEFPGTWSSGDDSEAD